MAVRYTNEYNIMLMLLDQGTEHAQEKQNANLIINTYSFYTYRLYLFLLYKNTSVVSTTERLLCFLLHSLLFCPLLNVGGVTLYCTALFVVSSSSIVILHTFIRCKTIQYNFTPPTLRSEQRGGNDRETASLVVLFTLQDAR